MGLEEQLYVKRFYITEQRYEIISLHNDFGDFSAKPVSKSEYGPYTSETEVQNHIASLRAERLKKGWQEYNKDSQDLKKEGKQDLWIRYFAQEKYLPLSKSKK